MINVSEKTIKTYTEYGCKKNITITFPDNVNIPTITNKNLQEESMKVLYGICQEDTLQVGGCNSTEFEITTFDIQQDITNKNIIVSLSVKDENFKGEWSSDNNYVEGDIVKFDQQYYEYIKTPSSDNTDFCERLLFDSSKWYSPTSHVIGISKQESDSLHGVVVYNWLENSTLFISAVYEDNHSVFYQYGNARKDFVLGKSISFPQQHNGYSLIGWQATISGNDSAEELLEFAQNTLKIEEIDYIPEYKLYPNQAPDVCQVLYGYLDTSEVEDFIIFRGKVKSFEKQSDPRYRMLLAYDKMCSLGDISIKEWINTVDSNGRGYIEKYNFRGEYQLNTTYKQGDSVVEYYTNDNNVTTTNYYRFKKDYVYKGFQSYKLHLVLGYLADRFEISPNDYVEKLGTTYYPNRTTVKTLRNNLCKYLGIVQEDAILPLDNVTLTIGEFKENVSARQLLTWICNLNMVFGYIVPETGYLRYIDINQKKVNVASDGNYVGDFSPEMLSQYNVGNVVKATNSYGETRYYESTLNLSDESIKFPSSFIETELIFMRVSNSIIYRSPVLRGNGWYIDFKFDNRLARELNVNVRVAKYRGDGEYIDLKQCGKVKLLDVLTSGYYTIQVSNVNDEFMETFSATLYSADGEYNTEWYIDEEELVDFWKPKNLLYHPSGRINLSNLYENDNTVVKDLKFKNVGYNVVDTSDNVIYGIDNNINTDQLNIIYSPLYSAWKSARQLYIDVNENVGHAGRYFTIEYTPFALSFLGLPFLEPGDYICFDILEWSSDEEDNPVQTVKTIESIILCRELSGINALMDKDEARYE